MDLRYVCCIATSAVLLSAPSLAFGQGTETVPPPPAVAPPAPVWAPAGAATPEGEEDSEAKPAENSVFAEGLGAGVLYSINYEHRVIDDLGVRVGFSYMSFGASSTSSSGTSSASANFLTFPVTASYLGIRGGKHALELGGGLTMTYASAAASGVGGSASASGVSAFGDLLVGYRLHPVGGAGFQFRVGIMALVGRGFSLSSDAKDPTALGVLPWGYISFGAGF